jgi:ribonuclease D
MFALPQHFVDSSAGLAECCDHLHRCPTFGFDTEFIGEDTFHPRLCLVQVATDERLFVIDPFAAGPLDTFWELAADRASVKVVHAGREETRMCRHGCGRPPTNLFDLQVAAGLVGLGYPMGYAALVWQVVRIQMSKAETLTNWAQRPLTARQLEYAYDDVRYLLPLWRDLSNRLEMLGRGEWAAEEFQHHVRRALADDPSIERWRKLRGLGSLDRRRLAVVREVFAWRESLAERQNRPARTVLRDDLVVEIARRLPQKDRDLSVLRGLPRFDFSGLLEAVRRGGQLSADEWPSLPERENDPPQIGLVVSLLMAVLGDFCARSALTAGLAATTGDVKLLVRSRYQGMELPAESSLTHGWRSRAVLPTLLAVLDGEQAVRVADVRAAAPLEVAGSAQPSGD